MTEVKMVGWHQRLSGQEFELAPGDGEGQGNLACCSPWGHKELDMTEQLSTSTAHAHWCLRFRAPGSNSLSCLFDF